MVAHVVHVFFGGLAVAVVRPIRTPFGSDGLTGNRPKALSAVAAAILVVADELLIMIKLANPLSTVASWGKQHAPSEAPTVK